MRLVVKNKEEGTELFKGAVDGTQYRTACAVQQGADARGQVPRHLAAAEGGGRCD